jgi:hypothetical protein
MSKLLTAIKTVVQGEPLTSTNRMNLAMVEQDAVLAGNEIDAAHRVLLLVSKARRDANIVGKDLVSNETLLATVVRARQHQATATQRLEKAAAEFARIAQDVINERRAVLLASKLKELRSRLAELADVLRKLPKLDTGQPIAARTKRWTVKSILAKAHAGGLRISKGRKDGHVTVWNRVGGITFWEDGSATRADVSADLAIRMTLRQAAEFLFPDER